MNYFVLNKLLDYRRGILENCQWTEGNLILSPGAEHGAFLSRIYDSRQAQTQWHRFVLQAQGPGRASLLFTFYASDSLEVFLAGKKYLLPEFLSDSGYSLGEKKKWLKPLEKKQAIFPEDMLLHEIKGRYLFFMAELFAQGEKSPSVGEMMIYFPKENWLKFLPGVYSREKAGADFISRYLGIFQSIYEEMDEKIRTSSRILDVSDVDFQGLGRLAEWLWMKNIYLWPEEKLRSLMERAQELFSRAGTVESMLRLIELYTGEKPVLIECGSVKGEQAEKLYGNNPYECILLIREKFLSTAKEYEALMCLADQMKPAHIQVRIIPLKPRIVLGTYSYLGINSRLQGFQSVKLDGRSSLAFLAVGAMEGGKE